MVSTRLVWQEHPSPPDVAFPSTKGRAHEGCPYRRRHPIVRQVMSEIKENMEVIGADGVHIGTVDKVEGHPIKLTKKDSGEGSHKGHHHYIDRGLVADIEGNKVRLSANAAVPVMMEEEK